MWYLLLFLTILIGGIVLVRKIKIPSNENKRIEIVEEENANLFFQNAMQDMKIEALEEENANLLLIVAGGMLNV